MGSDVVFDSPYLDRYLKFGWYLDIILLLLLGDTSLMFGPDSVVDMDDWDCTFDDGWSDVVRFFDLPYVRCHTGAYFRSDWDLQVFMELHAYPHLRDTRRDDDLFIILSWYPSGASLEPFNQTHTFRHLDVIMILLLEYVSLIYWVQFSYGRGWLGLPIWWWMIWGHPIFRPIPHLIPYWGIFSLRLRFIDLHWFCMIILNYEIHVRLMICFHFVLILKWSLSWFI